MGSPLTLSQSMAGLSLWHETTPTDWTPRPPLDGDVEADVAIVGAGYTGLWTAYYLSLADPTLRIVVVEAEVAGFGASGRNGGWCSALFPTSLGEAQDAAMRASVDEVQRVALAEGIDCHFAKGGTIVLARNKAQLARARSEYGDQVLSPAEAGERLRATRTLGATYTPDCAAIHPARLVRGLAEVVTRRGVALHERTPALSIEPGVVRTRTRVGAGAVRRARDGGVHAPAARAGAGGGAGLLADRRDRAPAPEVWDEIGLAQRETFSDHRHLIIYGQRTADDRLVFGGRGAPYHLRSRISPAFDRDPRVFAALHATLLDLFPVLQAPGSPTPGAGRSGSRATGAPRWGWTAAPGWPGPAATSATASRPPTWPAGPSAT